MTQPTVSKHWRKEYVFVKCVTQWKCLIDRVHAIMALWFTTYCHKKFSAFNALKSVAVMSRLEFCPVCCLGLRPTTACEQYIFIIITIIIIIIGWWSGVVVSTLALINEVNQHQAWLVLRWATVSGFNSRCQTFISVCNQPATQGQLGRPSLRGQ